MFDVLGPTVSWVIAGVAAIVVLDLIFVVEIPRAVREFRRLTARLGAYGDLPIVSALGVAERDGERIRDAVGEIGALVGRAAAEVTEIRTGFADISRSLRRR